MKKHQNDLKVLLMRVIYRCVVVSAVLLAYGNSTPLTGWFVQNLVLAFVLTGDRTYAKYCNSGAVANGRSWDWPRSIDQLRSPFLFATSSVAVLIGKDSYAAVHRRQPFHKSPALRTLGRTTLAFIAQRLYVGSLLEFGGGYEITPVVGRFGYSGAGCTAHLTGTCASHY